MRIAAGYPSATVKKAARRAGNPEGPEAHLIGHGYCGNPEKFERSKRFAGGVPAGPYGVLGYRSEWGHPSNTAFDGIERDMGAAVSEAEFLEGKTLNFYTPCILSIIVLRMLARAEFAHLAQRTKLVITFGSMGNGVRLPVAVYAPVLPLIPDHQASQLLPGHRYSREVPTLLRDAFPRGTPFGLAQVGGFLDPLSPQRSSLRRAMPVSEWPSPGKESLRGLGVRYRGNGERYLYLDGGHFGLAQRATRRFNPAGQNLIGLIHERRERYGVG
jgi:hypothetical protein